MPLPQLGVLGEEVMQARINPEFVGIGHELQARKRRQREIQLEESKMVNRVVFLEKEEQKAERTLQRKKIEFETLLNKINRRREESEEKERLAKKRDDQIKRLKDENRRRREDHQGNKRNAFLELYEGNHSQYKKLKSTLAQSMYQRSANKRLEMDSKKQNAMQLSLQKQSAKQRINQFHKNRNDGFTRYYQDCIQQKEEEIGRSISAIKWLENEENANRERLQNSSSRISQMEQMINTAYMGRSQGKFKLKTNKEERYQQHTQ